MTTTSINKAPGNRFAISIVSDVQVTAFLSKDEFLRFVEQVFRTCDELKKNGEI